jgi:hypothetical protein
MSTRVYFSWIALLAGGCTTAAQSVCQDIGYCKTFTPDQEHSCEMSVKQLETEAASSGCSSQYSAYFNCADDRYECEGNVPTFNGCEAAREALDLCLSMARASNACGQLSEMVAACGGPPPDPTLPPSPCGAAEVCASRCYLDFVADVCFPQATQIAQAGQCAQQCPL